MPATRVSDDDRMNELDRDVLRIRGVRASSKCQQPPSSQNRSDISRQAMASGRACCAKKSSKIWLRSKSRSWTSLARSSVFDHLRLLADSRQRIAHQHVHDTAASVTRRHQNSARGLFAYFTDQFGRRPPGVSRKASSATSACSAATTARNCPSFAM